MRIGCIGLGHIGYHFAANLQRAGYEVTVHDIDKAKAAGCCAAGASVGGNSGGDRTRLRGGHHVSPVRSR